jgi:hypothetical protein
MTAVGCGLIKSTVVEWALQVPPVMAELTPVMYEASSLSKNATA